jgi:outer membrane receptor protein involved in Fe transport
MSLGVAIKSSDDRLDYDLDYRRRGLLAAEESIQSAGVEIQPNVDLSADAVQVFDDIVKVWLSGGANGRTYTVTVTATTTGGRVKDACFKLRIRDC